MTATPTPPAAIARRTPSARGRGGPPPGPPRTLDMLFTRTARRVPTAIAVWDAQGRLSYGEAESRATRLAGALLHSGVQLGEPVIVHCDDHRQGLVAQLAVLKAGGVCVPVPAETGRAGRARISAVSGARTALCSASTRTAWERRDLTFAMDDPATWVLADTLPPDPALPCSAAAEGAYLLVGDEDDGGLDSGHLTDHRAWQLVLSATTSRLGVTDGTVVSERPLGIRTLSAMWWAFACAGTLHARTGDLEALPAGAGRRTTAVGVFSPEEYARVLASATTNPSARPAVFRTVLLIGGPCPPDLVRRHFEVLPETRLWAQFVPAGGSLPWTMHEFSRQSGPDGDDAAVGHSLPHVHVQILAPEGGVMPVGGIGEVCASGPALAFDRIHAPSRHPQAPDTTPLLRSGWLGRWRANGTLEIAGPAPGLSHGTARPAYAGPARDTAETAGQKFFLT